MVWENLEAVKQRYNFYRDNYRLIVKIFLGALILILTLSAAIFYLLSTEQEPNYYVTSRDNRIKRIFPTEPPTVVSEFVNISFYRMTNGVA